MTPLTAQSTVGAWLDHPVAGSLLVALLDAQGTDPAQLAPIKGFPLQDMVAMSNGRFTATDLDGLVEAAAAQGLVDESPAPAAVADVPVRGGWTLADIQIRDPYVLVDGETYYLYGSTDKNIWYGPGVGFDTYKSSDLETWEGPYPAFRRPEGFWSEGSFWAPEVHPYEGRWYMFATFTGPKQGERDGYRGTQVLVADSPDGPFEPWSDGPVTPRKWQCLDATLWVEDGEPWMVFCQEWTQIHDGAIWAQRLSADLAHPVGVPVFLFNASDAAWAKATEGRGGRLASYVTDGPFLYRLENGHLLMLWSSFGDQGYAMGVAHSTTGHVTGPWTQEDTPIWAADGGHGMIVRLLDGSLAITLHQPNDTPNERAVIRPLVTSGDTIRLADS